MSLERRSACQVLVALAVAMGLNSSTVQAALYRVDATVAATFTTGPAPTATGSFSFRFDDAFLMGSPVGDRGDWPVSHFQTSLNPIGSTTFSPSNVEGYVFYNQGSLRQVLVGGVGPMILDENTVGGNSNDFFISLSLKPNGQLDDTFGSPGSFVWSNTDEIATYHGDIVTSASSLTITPVAEPASGTLAALVGVLAACARSRRMGM